MTRAALLDAPADSGRGVYLRMVECEGSELTDRHLATITACDLPAGRYVWLPSEDPRNTHKPNQYGGAFFLKRLLDLGVPVDQFPEIIDESHRNMERAVRKAVQKL